MKSIFKIGDEVKSKATGNVYTVSKVHINPLAFNQPKIYLGVDRDGDLYAYEDELELMPSKGLTIEDRKLLRQSWEEYLDEMDSLPPIYTPYP